jgi:hypothetical protein
VFTFSETWLDNPVINSELEVFNYSFTRCDAEIKSMAIGTYIHISAIYHVSSQHQRIIDHVKPHGSALILKIAETMA